MDGSAAGNKGSAAWQHAAIIVVAAVFCLAVFDSPRFVAGALNADSLMPVTFWWDVLNVPGGAQHHETARIPSLVPDLVGFGVVYTATRSLAASYMGYGFVQFLLLVYGAGMLVARLGRVRWGVGGLAAAGLLAGVGLVGLAEGDWNGLGVVLPLLHAGPFAVSLLGVGMAAALVGRRAPRLTAGVAAVSALVFLSDQLLIVTFALPVALAGGVLWWMGRIDRAALGRVLFALGAGLALGKLGMRLLHGAGLRTGVTPSIRPSRFLANARGFVEGMPGYAGDFPWHAALLVVGLGAVLVGALVGARRLGRVETGMLFVWLAGLLSCAGIVAFTGLFYEDLGSYRYLGPVSVWPVVLLGAGLTRAPRSLAAAFVAGCAVVLAGGGWGRPGAALAAFDTADARCLRELRGRLGLHAALGGYWHARPAMVALGMSMQIDAIRETGAPSFWENDPAWYRHSIGEPMRAPVYDAVLMAGMDAEAVRQRLGAPSSVHACGGSVLWRYDDGVAVQRRLMDGVRLQPWEWP